MGTFIWHNLFFIIACNSTMMLFWCKLMQLYSMALWYFVIPWYFAPKGGTMRRLLVSFLSGIHWFQCLLHLPSVSLSSIFSSYHSSGRSGCLCYCQPLTDNLRVLWISYIYFLNWPTIHYSTTLLQSTHSLPELQGEFLTVVLDLSSIS